ncbi:head-tail connector protein [Amaricoccus sp. W119]|uniref:head-tail connector protein n=1 Tax=Amaricoccus sp. W119 TaxID=3391833 RepID=UPI0039A4A622
MILTEVSAPTAEAMPIRAFGEHLRLGTGFADDGSQDTILEVYLRSAMASIEARIGQALLSRPFVATLGRWQSDSSQTLPLAPVASVSSVALLSGDDDRVELATDTWSLLRDRHRPRLVGRFGRYLPRIPRGGQAEIRFVAGYGPAWEDVPADLRQAVLLLAAHFYEHRAEGALSGAMFPGTVLTLIETHRAVRIGRGVA